MKKIDVIKNEMKYHEILFYSSQDLYNVKDENNKKVRSSSKHVPDTDERNYSNKNVLGSLAFLN